QAVLPRDARHGGDGVERGGARSPGGADDGARLAPGREVGTDGLFQGLGTQGEILVVGNVADVLAAETTQQRRLVHGTVAVRRRVNHQRLRFRLQPAAVQPETGGALAGAD